MTWPDGDRRGELAFDWLGVEAGRRQGRLGLGEGARDRGDRDWGRALRDGEVTVAS